MGRGAVRQTAGGQLAARTVQCQGGELLAIMDEQERGCTVLQGDGGGAGPLAAYAGLWQGKGR